MLSEKSQINIFMAKYDYCDSFTCELCKPNVSPVESIKLFFLSTPWWFRLLVFIRENLVRLIGLKTSQLGYQEFHQKLEKFSGTVGEKVGLFNVYYSSNQEIILGEKDKHLDFCFSFLVSNTQNNSRVILLTTVKFNNWLGRLYFLPVGIVHRLVMKNILQRMARNSRTE